MGRGQGKGKAGAATVGLGGCGCCLVVLGVAGLIVGLTVGAIGAAGPTIVQKVVSDTIDDLTVDEVDEFDAKSTSKVNMHFFSINNLQDIMETADTTWSMTEYEIEMSTTTVAYDLDYSISGYDDWEVITWKRDSNYTVTAGDTSQLITNVNPVMVGALGQEAGYESLVYIGFSYKIVQVGLVPAFLESFPTVLMFLGGGMWLENVAGAVYGLTAGTGVDFLPSYWQSQWSGFAYSQDLLGSCAWNGYEYVGYCTLEDVFLYQVEDGAEQAVYSVVNTAYESFLNYYSTTTSAQVAEEGYMTCPELVAFYNTYYDPAYGTTTTCTICSTMLNQQDNSYAIHDGCTYAHPDTYIFIRGWENAEYISYAVDKSWEPASSPNSTSATTNSSATAEASFAYVMSLVWADLTGDYSYMYAGGMSCTDFMSDYLYAYYSLVFDESLMGATYCMLCSEMLAVYVYADTPLDGIISAHTGCSYVDYDTYSAPGSMSDEEVATVWDSGDQTGIANVNGSLIWTKAVTCAMDDFANFTEADIFSASYNAYVVWATTGSLDSLTSCEQAYMAAFFTTGAISYPATLSSNHVFSVMYYLLVSATGEGLIEFAKYGMGMAGFDTAGISSAPPDWAKVGALQWATGAVTITFGLGDGLYQMGLSSSLVVPAELTTASAEFNASAPENTYHPGTDFFGCSEYYVGCGPFVGSESSYVEGENLAPLSASEAEMLIHYMSNYTASSCLYTARYLYTTLQSMNACAAAGLQTCAAYGEEASSAECAAILSTFEDGSANCHAALSTLADDYLANFASSDMADLKLASGKTAVAPACRNPLETMFNGTGVTYDNLIALTTYFHAWAGSEFFLKGAVSGLKGEWPGLHTLTNGVGETNSGLFTERTILEIIEGYNDTMKGYVLGASEQYYDGLQGAAKKRFNKPDQLKCTNGYSEAACDLFGEYPATGNKYMAMGVKDVDTRTDIDQECEETIYPYQIHFPDSSGNYEGYDSCQVWKSLEKIDGSGKMGIPPQHEDFIPDKTKTAYAKITEYEHPDFSFYNSMNARAMNFTYIETTTYTSPGGGSVIDCFKYKLEDDMWLASNEGNAKYRHEQSAADYVMELTSQNGVAMYLSKPYLKDSSWADEMTYTNKPDIEESFIKVEPLMGAAIHGYIALQVNFGLHNMQFDGSALYDNVMSDGVAIGDGGFETTMVPFFYVEIEAEMNDDQASDYVDIFDTVDKAFTLIEGALALGGTLFIVGIVLLVLGVCSCGGAGATAGGGQKVYSE